MTGKLRLRRWIFVGPGGLTAGVSHCSVAQSAVICPSLMMGAGEVPGEPVVPLLHDENLES